MFENTPSDKIQFRALGEAPAPGTCLVCGAANREDGYIDLGIWVEYVGQALMCSTCLTQAAELIGMMLPDEVAHIQNVAAQNLESANEAKEELEAANERLQAFDTLLTSNHRAYLGAIGASDAMEPTLFDESSEESGVRERETEESLTVERGVSESGETREVDSEEQPAALIKL
jgi:hypothetical protein